MPEPVGIIELIDPPKTGDLIHMINGQRARVGAVDTETQTCTLNSVGRTLLVRYTLPRRCPDQGRCHHECGTGACFRVGSCGPLSGVFPDNRWPAEIVDEHRNRDRATRGYADYMAAVESGALPPEEL